MSPTRYRTAPPRILILAQGSGAVNCSALLLCSTPLPYAGPCPPAVIIRFDTHNRLPFPRTGIASRRDGQSACRCVRRRAPRFRGSRRCSRLRHLPPVLRRTRGTAQAHREYAAGAAHRVHCRPGSSSGTGLVAGLRGWPQPGRILRAGGRGQPAVRGRPAAGPETRALHAGSRSAGSGRHGCAPQAAGRRAGFGFGAGGARGGGLRRQFQLAGPDSDRRSRRSGKPRDRAGQGGGRPPRGAAPRERAFPLPPAAAGAGAVNRAIELAKAAGARRAVLLPVSAPFHCALMRPAQERLREDLDATEFRDLERPLVCNWQAREVRTGTDAREGLYQQVSSPVRWVDSIRYLVDRGVAQAVEVGQGSVLTGLLRGIAPSVAGLKFGEPADLETLPR